MAIGMQLILLAKLISFGMAVTAIVVMVAFLVNKLPSMGQLQPTQITKLALLGDRVDYTGSILALLSPLWTSLQLVQTHPCVRL